MLLVWTRAIGDFLWKMLVFILLINLANYLGIDIFTDVTGGGVPYWIIFVGLFSLNFVSLVITKD